jgi:hypothetical protein
MRKVASACLVLAILLMVGCGTSAEDKKMITDQGVKIAALEKSVADMTKMATDMGAKLTAVETFLKDGKSKFGGYGVVPDTTKKVTTTTTTKTTTKTEPAKKAPEKAPVKTK